MVALWLYQRFDLSLAAAGAVFFWTGVLTAGSYLIAVRIAGRFGLVNTMVFTHIPSSACLILLPFAPNLGWAIALLFLRSALSQMDVPTRSSYVMAIVTPAERPADRLKALRRFAERCRTDRRHVEQVLRLAERLFQVLGKHLGCASEDWPLLEAAALVHDVGQLVSYRGHHKHSFHLIAHADALPFPPRERLLLAVISRYHRKAPPSKKHPEFAQLTQEERARVRRIAAILRLADGLDRGHVSAVESLRLRLLPGRLLVDVTPRLVTTDLKLELWGAQRKADLLKELLDREVTVRAPALAPQSAAAARAS